MDRIKNLSLSQKAKLYYMGLLKRGIIDTLPEDPKAAFVRDMMDKKNPRMDPSVRSDFDDPVFETRDEEDEENDRKLASDDIPPSLREKASQLGYFKEESNFNSQYNDLAQDEFGLDYNELNPSDAEWVRYEVDNEGYLEEIDSNEMQYQKVEFVYSEQGGRFYGLDVYVSKDQRQRSDKLRYDEANKWLKGILEYIHEGDLIPQRYVSGIEDLDLIVDRLKELGIEASHNDFMDVS